MRVIIGNAALRQELAILEQKVEILEAKLQGMTEINALYRQTVQGEEWRQAGRAEAESLFTKVMRSLSADAVAASLRQGVKP